MKAKFQNGLAMVMAIILMIVFSGVLEAREVSQSRTDVRSRRGVKSVDSAVQENIEDTSVASTSAATENKGQKIETKVITVKPLQLDKTKKYFIEDGAVYELDLNRESIEKKTENILKLNDYWFAVRPDGHIIAIKKIVNGELTIDNSGITDDRLEIKDSERGIRSRHRMIKSKTQTSTRKTEKRKIKSVGGKETAADEDETAEPEAQQTLPLPELTGDNYYFVGGDGYVYLFDWTKNEIIKFNKYQDSIEQYKAILILRIGEKKIIDVNEGTISDAEYKIDSSKIEEDKTDTQRGLKSRSKLKSAERSSSSTRANASKLKKLKMVDKSKVTNKKNSRSRARGVRSSSDDSSDNTGLELDKNLLNELNLVVDCIYSQINDINLGAEAIINLGAASFKFARIDENNFSGEITLKYLNAGNDLIIPVKGVKKNISQHKLFEFTASVPNPLSNIPAVKDILNNDICSISQSADFIAQFPEKKILQDNLNDSLIIRTPIQLKIDPTKNKLNLFAQLDLKKILEGQNEIPVQFGLTPEQQWQQPFGILPGSVEKFLLSFIYDSKANKASKYKTDIQVRADGFGLIKLDMPELPDFSPNVKINLTFPEININSLFARINDLFSKIGMPKLNFEIGQLALNCNMPSLGSFSFNGLIIPLKFKGFPEMGDIKIDLGVPKLDIDAILNSLEMELAFKFFESFFWKIGLKFPDVGAEFGFNLELVKLNMIRASKTEFKGKLTVKYLNGGKDIVVDATAGLDKAKGRFNVKAKIPNVVKNIPLFDLYEKYLSAIKYPSDYVDVEMWFEPQNQAQKILVSMPFDYAIDPQRGPVKCYINIDLLNKGLKGGLREGERWENPIIVIPPSNIIYLPLTVITDFNIGGSPDFSYMELKTNMKSELLGNVRCDFLYSSQDMEARIDLAADGVTKSRIAELIEKNVKIPKEITQFIGDIVMSLEITNIRAKFDVRSLIQGTPPKYSMKVKYKSAIYEEDFDISVKSLNPAEFIKPICEQIFEKILKNLDKVILKVLENTGKLIAQGATIAFNETSKYAEIAAVEVAKGLESFGKDAGKFFEQGGSEIAETFVDFGNDVAEFFGKKTKETPPIVYGYDMASKIIYKKFSAAAFKLAMTYLENYEKTARVIEKNYEKTLKSLESPEFNAAKSVNPKKFEESIEKLKNDTVFKKWEELKYIAIRDIFKLTNDITSSDVKRFIPANTKEVVYELSDEDFIKLGRDRDIAVNEIKGQVIKWMDTKRESMIKKPPVRKIVYRYTDQYSEVAADISIQILGQTIGSTNLKLLWKPVAPSGWSILGYAMNADARNNQSKPSAKTIIVRNDDYIFRKGYSLQTINTFSEKLTVGKGKLGLVLSGTDASGNSHSFDDVVVPKRSEYFDIGSYAFKNKFAGASYILAKNDVNANIIHCGLGTGPGLDQLLTLNDNAVWTEEQCEKAVAPVRAELTTALDKKDKDAIEKNLAALLELTGYEKNIIPRALQTLLFLDIIEKGESLLYKIETSSNPELFYTIVKDHYNAAISAVSGQQLKSIINNNWKFFKSKSNIAEWLTESVKSYPAYTSAVLANEAKAKLDAAIKVIDFYVNLKQAQLNFANLDKTRALQNLDFLNNNYPDSRQVFKSLRESVIEDINAANKLIALAAEYRQSKNDWELAQTYSKLITINLDDNIKNLLKADVNLKDHISYFFDYRDKISVMHNTFTANFVKAELSDGDWLAGLSAAEKCANFAGQFSYPQLESFIKNNEIFAKPEMANKYYLAIISFIKNRNQITDNLYNYPDKNLTLPFEVICADMEKNIAVLSDYNFIYNDPVYDILKEEYDFLKEKIAGFAVSFNSGKEFMKSYQYAEALKSFIEAGNVIYGDSFGFEFVCQKSPKFDLSTLFSSYLQAYGSFLTDNVYAEISAGNIEITADDMNIINTMKKWVGTNLNSSNDSTIEKLNSISNIHRLYSVMNDGMNKKNYEKAIINSEALIKMTKESDFGAVYNIASEVNRIALEKFSEELIKKARNHFNAKNYKEAYSIYIDAIKKHPVLIGDATIYSDIYSCADQVIGSVSGIMSFHFSMREYEKSWDKFFEKGISNADTATAIYRLRDIFVDSNKDMQQIYVYKLINTANNELLNGNAKSSLTACSMAIFFWPQHNYSVKLFELLNKENINISVINTISVKNAFDSFYAVLTGTADAAAFKTNAPKLFNGENNLYQQILALMLETIDKTPEYSAMTIVSNRKYYFDSHKSLLDCFELLKTKTPVIPITAAGLITGKIVVFDNGDTKAMTGMGFSKISLGEDGTLFGVTTTGSAMYGNIKTTGMATLAPISSTIKYSKIVCADSMIVFCIDTLGKLYKKDAANKWTVVNPGTTVGTFRDISVAKDGTIVAVNTKNEIYKFDGGVWTKIFTDTVINKIAICDKNNIWRVNTAFQIFKYDGSEWTEISTSFKCLTITVNSKNEVLAIESSTFAIYSYENGEWKKSDLPIGKPIDIDIK